MFAVIFICENFFLRIAGKITKIAKIRARKNIGGLSTLHHHGKNNKHRITAKKRGETPTSQF